MARRNKKGQFQKGMSGNPGGLKAGTKRKATEIKESFFQAFEDMGGVKALTKWAKQNSNKGAFYTLLTRLIPRELEVEEGVDISECGNCPYPKTTYIFTSNLKPEKEEKDIVITPALTKKAKEPEYKALNNKSEQSREDNLPVKTLSSNQESKQVSQIKKGWGAA